MKQSGSEIRALFSKAGVGQDGTDIHIALPTEAEATTVFEHICEIGDGYAEYGLMKPRWRWDWSCSWWWCRTDEFFMVWVAPGWTMNFRRPKRGFA